MTPEQIAAASSAFASEVRAAVLPIVPICEPWQYSGDALEYCVFQFFETSTLFAGSRPAGLIFHLTVDWYTPGVPGVSTVDTNPEPRKSQIREAVYSLGGSWPTITDASDETGLHYVFETEVPR